MPTTRIDDPVIHQIERWEQIRQEGTADLLEIPFNQESEFQTAIAVSPRAKEAVFRLRYKVFNEELGVGLKSSEATGLDTDRFDEQMDHMVLYHTATSTIVGTYRLQSYRHGMQHQGVYCSQEFDLSPLDSISDSLVELGRACLTEEHRSMRALIQMWAGIGAYLNLLDHRYLFGCCSITGTDPSLGWQAMNTLRRRKVFHPDLLLKPQPELLCGEPETIDELKKTDERIKLPKLFSAYLRLGCQVISEPGLDREFGTVVFLILLDAVENVRMSSLNIVGKNNG